MENAIQSKIETVIPTIHLHTWIVHIDLENGMEIDFLVLKNRDLDQL